MANDGKIYIIVTDKLPSGGTEPQPGVQSGEKNEKKSDKDILAHYAYKKLINTVESLANNAVHYSLGNIGNFTGNYQAQREIDNALSILGEIGSFGAALGAGFIATGSPWGAVIAGLAHITQKSVAAAEFYHSLNIQERKSNYTIEQLRNRSGLNSHTNWNRGTEN